MSVLDRDVKAFLRKYISFEIAKPVNPQVLTIKGMVDVIDDVGHFWERFEVAIVIEASKYHYVVPKVYALGTNVYKTPNWHIAPNGECCLDIPHKLILESKRGINLIGFYQGKVYPFFANYCYKKETGNYANGEYDHLEAGIVQFYTEELGLVDKKEVLSLINFALTNNAKVGRNELCPVCGGNKYKKCCGSVIGRLKSFGQEQLDQDRFIFEKHA